MSSMDPALILAKLIASRLDAVAPTGVSVIESDGIVGIYFAASFWGGTNVGSLFRRDDASIEELSLLVMGSVQDQVAEALREPWPFRGDSDEALARPVVRRVDDEIHLAFEGAGNTLALKPLRVLDLVPA